MNSADAEKAFEESTCDAKWFGQMICARKMYNWDVMAVNSETGR